MNFNFSDEQEQLREMLQRFVRQDYSFDKRREILASSEGFSREIWKRLADLGVLAMTLPSAHGGLGGDAFDSLVIMDATSRGMLLEPYVSTVVIGAGLIAHAGSEAQRAEILPAVAAGERLLAFAHQESGVRFERQQVALRASVDADGWLLNGSKNLVLDGASADQLLVSARIAGDARDAAGISLFVVDANSTGIRRRGISTHDGRRAAQIDFENVRVGADSVIGVPGQGLELIDLALDLGIAAVCAEAVGIMDALVKETSEYLKQRKQFGVAIGSFQVLQHRVVDMLMSSEQARSMSYLAAHSLTLAQPQRSRNLAAAKAVVGQAARLVGQSAVQLHGGIAVCDEVVVSHWFKRLTMININFGDAEHHLARFSDQLAATEA